MTSNKNATWVLGESVGEWFTRRLSEEFNKRPSSEKITAKGNPLDPKKWLSTKAMVHSSTLYTLAKSEELHISREVIRDKLSKCLGLYGYPIYSQSVDAKEKNISISAHLTKDFRYLTQRLPSLMSGCPFCSSDTNYFLGIDNKVGKALNKKSVKKFYVASHNFKQFGAAQEKRVSSSFEVEILICEECLASYEKLFTSPVFEIIKDLKDKFKHLNLSYKNIGTITGVDEPTISKIVNGKILTIDGNLLKKIIGLWTIGNLKPYELTYQHLYKEYMTEAVKVVLGEIDLEDFISTNDLRDILSYTDVSPDIEDGFYLENSSYTPTEFYFDVDGIYVRVEASYSYEKRIRDMIYVQNASQLLLITLATPDNENGRIEVLENCVNESERVC